MNDLTDRTRFEEAHAPLSVEMLDDEGETVSVPEHRLPRLMGWTVLLRPYTAPKKTRSGLFLPDQVVDANEHLAYVFQVVKLGPLAFANPRLRGGARHGRRQVLPADVVGTEDWFEEEETDFAEGVEPPKPGDWVVVRKYSGIRLELDGVSFRLTNDDDLLAVIDSPSGWKAYV